MIAGRGYARPKFDALASAHPIEKSRLMTDRSAYISFLEVQLERVTSSCLTVQAFSDRIEQLQSQILTMEDRIINLTRSNRALRQQQTTDVSPAVVSMDSETQISALSDKVNRLERELLKSRGVPASPAPGSSAPSDEWVKGRLRETEQTCARLAEDTFGAVEGMHAKFSNLEISCQESTVAQVGECERRMTLRLSEAVRRITQVLRKVVSAQRALHQQQPLTLGGNVNVTLRGGAGVEVPGNFSPKNPRSPVRQKKRRSVTPPPTPPITPSLRQRALEELFRELELLEIEQQSSAP